MSSRGNVSKRRRKAVGGGCNFMQSWTTQFKSIKPSNQGVTKAFVRSVWRTSAWGTAAEQM